jgi:replicative DNA helicase
MTPTPHSAESEMALLGAMILDKKVIPDVVAMVPADAFYREANRAVYDAIRDVHDETGTVDLVQVLAYLEAAGCLPDVGGADYLGRLAEATPSAASFTHYAKIVLDRWKLRRLANAAAQAIHLTQSGDSESALAKSAALMAEVFADAVATDDLADYADTALEVFTELELGKPTVWQTGFTAYDNLIGGLPQNGLVYVMGEPGSGKSSLACQLAYGVASLNQIPATVFSFEVGAKSAARNLLAADSMVPLNKMAQRGETFKSDDARKRVIEAMGRAKGVPLRFAEKNLSIDAMEARISALAAKGHKLFVVDYIQNIPSDNPKETEASHIASICRRLQILKVRHHIGIIAVCQMTKAATAEQRFPRKSDAYGSAAIDQTSDMTIAVHRPGLRIEQTPDLSPAEWSNIQSEAYLCILKSKVTAIGNTRVHFEGSVTRFFNHGETIYAKPLVDGVSPVVLPPPEPTPEYTPEPFDEEIPF